MMLDEDISFINVVTFTFLQVLYAASRKAS